MRTIREIFSENLRFYRAGRTQAEMAEFIGIPFRTYQNMESGVSLPQQASISVAALKLGVSEAQLFQDRSSMPKPSPLEAWKVLSKQLRVELPEGALDSARLAEPTPAPTLSDRDRRILDALRGLNDEDLDFILEDVVPDVKAGLDRRPADTGQSARITRKPQKG